MLLSIFPFLGSHTKKEKIQKKISKNIWKKSKKIIGVRKGCWNAHKITIISASY
jgi:hypothetical protein